MKIKIIKNVLDNPTWEEDITKYIGRIFEVVAEDLDGNKYIMPDDDEDDLKIFKGEFEIVEENN